MDRARQVGRSGKPRRRPHNNQTLPKVEYYSNSRNQIYHYTLRLQLPSPNVKHASQNKV